MFNNNSVDITKACTRTASRANTSFAPFFLLSLVAAGDAGRYESIAYLLFPCAVGYFLAFSGYKYNAYFLAAERKVPVIEYADSFPLLIDTA